MGSLPPFVSSYADPHRDGENRNHILAASPDDRVTPTRVGKGSGWHPPPASSSRVIPTHAGKMGRYSPPALAVGSSPPGWGGAGCAL